MGTKAVNKKQKIVSKTDVFDRKAFSEALLTKRCVKDKLSIREAAAMIGISYPTLSRIENGNIPDVYTYFYCCQWLGVKMNQFFINQQ